MSHAWKMWVNMEWYDGDMYSSVHLTEKGAFRASIKDMVEILHGGAELPKGFKDPGDLSCYDLETLHEIWDDMQDHFMNTTWDFDIQESTVMP